MMGKIFSQKEWNKKEKKKENKKSSKLLYPFFQLNQSNNSIRVKKRYNMVYQKLPINRPTNPLKN